MDKKWDCLMLHGWGFRHNVWENFSRHLTGFDTVLKPCLYELVDQDDSTQGDVFHAMACRLNTQINKNCVVIAWSMGGLIALHLSGLSDKVQAIIFIASTPCFVNKDRWQNVIPSHELEMLQQELSDNPVVAMRKFTNMVAQGDPSARATIRALQQSTVSAAHMPTLLACLHGLRETDLRDRFSSLKIPVYVLLGRRDVLINCAIVQQLKQLNVAIESSVIDDSGHTPFISQAELTQQRILGFLGNAEIRA